MRYRTRADANQKEIDRALRSVGASVVSLGNVGKGCPDRLVGFRDKMYLMETKNKSTGASRSIKSRENHMRSPDQIRFHREWQGGEIFIIYSPDEALKIIGAIPK